MVYPNFLKSRVTFYKEKTIKTANDTLDTVLKVAALALLTFTIVWVSIFLYVAFYYTYVPSIQHVKPINLQFESCEEEKRGVCSFPTAHVQLTKSNQILMIGQPYRILIELEMPESPANRDLGMFMICGRLAGKGGVVISHSCRSTMLRYHSPLVRTLNTLTFAALYIFGSIEEKQTIVVELFSHHEEDQSYPVTDVYIEIKSQAVEVYSSKLYVNAHLTGLRYLMFHWPVVSAAFGISFNLCVIVFIALLSWWQLYGPYVKGRDYLYEKLKDRLSPDLRNGSDDEDGTLVRKEVDPPNEDSDTEEFIEDLKQLDASTDA